MYWFTTLFHHYVINVKQVKINFLRWDKQFKNRGKRPQFGCSLFRSIFYVNDDTFNTTILIQLFKNMNELIMFNIYNTRRGYNPSLDLNDRFVANIIESINILNILSSSSSLRFAHFIIVKPKSSITSFINDNQNRFKSINWYLSKQTYKDNWGTVCDDCLFISPLKN